MDPQSKRTFWNVITVIFKDENKSAILTTHSMEEAEALCNRIGILVKGELKYYSPLHGQKCVLMSDF